MSVQAEEQDLSDTLASRGPVSAETAIPSDSRHVTVLPRVEWTGEIPRLVASNRARFEKVGFLGAGGMGEVLLVKDHDIHRTVALKRLPQGVDMGQVLRFVDEVRTVGSLEHPNIVPVHDVGVDAEGRLFFVMKRLDGETLESVLGRLRAGEPEALAKYSFPMRVQIFRGILSAVAYAHGEGFVHRDLKPANIMLGPFGEVTVMDWGLAKRIRGGDGGAPRTLPGGPAPEPAPPDLDTSKTARPGRFQTQLGNLMGTPLYMSPEQARGEHDRVDERSDIYSLAVVLHEFLNLRHYLSGRETLADVLQGVQTDEAPRPNGFRFRRAIDAVPPELAWLLRRGMAKDPAARFQTVTEMNLALQRVIDGNFAVQCAGTMTKRMLQGLTRAIDRWPVPIMTSLGVGGVLALVGVVKLAVDLSRGF